MADFRTIDQAAFDAASSSGRPAVRAIAATYDGTTRTLKVRLDTGADFTVSHLLKDFGAPMTGRA